MPINQCRVCKQSFLAEPLLRYENMPKAAQCLPDAETLEQDRGVDLEVCQCSGCGLVQLSNDPVPYYKEVIRAAAFSEEMKAFRKQQFAGFVQQFSLKEKKVIEVGCGRGEFLTIMLGLCVQAYGIEQSQASVECCIKDGLNVSRGFIDRVDYKLDSGPFDAFFILNFLEHIPDPSATLMGICNNLSEDGIGLVEVPNFDMILRKSLFSEFINDHLFYFTKETLALVLSMNGFEVIECREIWYDYIISAIVRKRKKTNLTRFYDYKNFLKNELEQYIHRFDGRKVAIWGAGHQALAVISLTDLTDKIRYVVDSAHFKQGKYTPATHLRIISPEDIEKEPVDAVIVMAASYSDEVAINIKRRFGTKISVAILRDYGLEIL